MKNLFENAVNVVETNEGVISSNTLFVGQDAVKNAEERFIAIIKENENPSLTALDAYLTDGYYEQGDWAVMISHPMVSQ